jgi:SAM-dependent methyltransferase
VTSDFDPIASEYGEIVQDAIAFGHQQHDFYTRHKAHLLLDLARRRLGTPDKLRVLDVGCGIGLTDTHLTHQVGELHGVDSARQAVTQAITRNPGVRYSVASDEDRLPYPDQYFDLAFAICVIHHVPPSRWETFTSELGRVVRPGGIVALMEHNPLNPLTRVVVRRCEFDRDAVLVGRRRATRAMQEAGLRPVERRYILFLPIDRPWSARLERLLAWLPLGAQHYVAGRRAAG